MVTLYFCIGALISLWLGYQVSGEQGREAFEDVPPAAGAAAVLVAMLIVAVVWPLLLFRIGYKSTVDKDK